MVDEGKKKNIESSENTASTISVCFCLIYGINNITKLIQKKNSIKWILL